MASRKVSFGLRGLVPFCPGQSSLVIIESGGSGESDLGSRKEPRYDRAAAAALFTTPTPVNGRCPPPRAGDAREKRAARIPRVARVVLVVVNVIRGTGRPLEQGGEHPRRPDVRLAFYGSMQISIAHCVRKPSSASLPSSSPVSLSCFRPFHVR